MISRWSSSRSSEARRGFTLIEIMAVIVISAILATVVALSLAGPNRTATMNDVIRRLTVADHLAREQARRSGKPASIRFDKAQGKMLRVASDEQSGDEQETTLWDLPAAVTLAEMRTISGSDKTSILCSRLGITPTYALALDSDNGTRWWIVVAGLTGDVTRANDEKQVDAIFQILSPSREVFRSAGNDAR